LRRALSTLSLVLLAPSVGLLTYFALSPSYVNEEGILLEEFWALDLGTTLAVLSAAMGLLWLVSFVFERTRRGR
jgi:hypothetical protein